MKLAQHVRARFSNLLSPVLLTSALVVGLGFTAAPAGTSIAAGTAPIDDQQTAFKYVFWLMTALSCLGILLATRLHDAALAKQQEKALAGKSIPRAESRSAPASERAVAEPD